MTRLTLLRYVCIFAAAGCAGIFAVCCTRSDDPGVPVERGDRIIVDFEGESKNGLPDPWTQMAHKKPANIQVKSRDDSNGEKVICLTCQNASFSLNRAVDIDVAQWRQVKWEWKADTLPVRADVNPMGKDDKVLQVLLAFEGRKAIKYMWDTMAPVGSTFDENIPFIVSVKEFVVESGPGRLGQWTGVTRNVYNDYKNLFGAEPPKLKGIRLQTNCQYTSSTCSGFVGKLTFEKAVP